jgi:hypothetical protein
MCQKNMCRWPTVDSIYLCFFPKSLAYFVFCQGNNCALFQANVCAESNRGHNGDASRRYLHFLPRFLNVPYLCLHRNFPHCMSTTFQCVFLFWLSFHLQVRQVGFQWLLLMSLHIFFASTFKLFKFLRIEPLAKQTIWKQLTVIVYSKYKICQNFGG